MYNPGVSLIFIVTHAGIGELLFRESDPSKLQYRTVLSIQTTLAAKRSKVQQSVTFTYQGDAIAGARQLGSTI